MAPFGERGELQPASLRVEDLVGAQQVRVLVEDNVLLPLAARATTTWMDGGPTRWSEDLHLGRVARRLASGGHSSTFRFRILQ